MSTTPAYAQTANKLYPRRIDRIQALDEIATEDELRNGGGTRVYNLVELDEAVVHRLIEHAPTYYAAKTAEEERVTAERAEAERPRTPAEQVAHLEAAAEAGEPVTAKMLADAKAAAAAEVELAEIVARGEKARATEAATARKRREKAIADAIANPPTVPAGLDEAVADAKTAIDRARAMVRDYHAQIVATKASLAEAGVPEKNMWGHVDTEEFDALTHGWTDKPWVTIDGVSHTATGISPLATIVAYAGGTRK